MRHAPLLLFVRLLAPALAACGGGAHPATTAPIASTAEPSARTTPAPTLAFTRSRFATLGLPAVARASEVVVVALSDSDGGRGYPNLRLEVRDRDDKTLTRLPVMSPDEYEQLVHDDQPTPALQARLDAANRELATLHGVHDLVAMKGLEPVPATGEELRHMCTGDGLDVDFRSGELKVFQHASQRPLVQRSASGWLAPERKPCAQCDKCSNPAFLAASYHARGINTLVVEIGFHGTDTCWEPGNAFHVVTW